MMWLFITLNNIGFIIKKNKNIIYTVLWGYLVAIIFNVEQDIFQYFFLIPNIYVY